MFLLQRLREPLDRNVVRPGEMPEWWITSSFYDSDSTRVIFEKLELYFRTHGVLEYTIPYV